MLKTLCIIPARFKSSRFEGKPLALINGVPMIQRTYNKAIASSADKVVVATDDKRIYDFCTNNSINVTMTSENCLTGTDRLCEVAKKNPSYDLYINIQGDEPIIDPKCIDEIKELFESNKDYKVFNLYKVMKNMKDVESKSIVKAIVNELDEIVYYSRLPVPYSDKGLEVKYLHHIPVYGFTADALQLFSSNTKSRNEKYENVELLRFIDNGMKIKCAETHIDSISVDYPEDILKIEAFLNSKEFNKNL